MERSESINELAAALCRVQAQVKSIPRTAENPFFKSKYADMASLHEATRPITSQHGLCVTSLLDTVDGKPHVVTMLLHSSGQFISGKILMTPAKADAQALGSYISYMRRYAEMAILGVASDDDDGEGAMDREKKTSKAQPAQAAAPQALDVKNGAPSDAQVKRLFTLCKQHKWPESALRQHMAKSLRKQSTKDLTPLEYEALCKYVQMHEAPLMQARD